MIFVFFIIISSLVEFCLHNCTKTEERGRKSFLMFSSSSILRTLLILFNNFFFIMYGFCNRDWYPSWIKNLKKFNVYRKKRTAVTFISFPLECSDRTHDQSPSWSINYRISTEDAALAVRKRSKVAGAGLVECCECVHFFWKVFFLFGKV